MARIFEKKIYLTRTGLEKIKKEYFSLKRIKESKMKETPQVIHSEDLDPQYLIFQEDIGFIEGRLNELEYILKNFELIKAPSKKERNSVHIGATVYLEDSDGKTHEYTIVGSIEADPKRGKISSESPLGNVLLGKKVGETIILHSRVPKAYKIKRISYNLS